MTGYKIIRAGIPISIHTQYKEDVFPVLEQFLKVKTTSQFLSSFHDENAYPRSRNKRPGTYALLRVQLVSQRNVYLRHLLLMKVVGTNIWMLYLFPVIRASTLRSLNSIILDDTHNTDASRWSGVRCNVDWLLQRGLDLVW